MATRSEWIAQLLEKSGLSAKTYADEPILQTASQMQNYLPERCRQMRRLAFQGGHRNFTSAEIFYKQGKFMEDYEDDCPYVGEFVRYFPTYESMSDRQLRGYFTWRTQVRQGDIRQTSLSFVYVYIYELLNGIGVSDPQEGYRTLCAFYDAYSRIDMQINRYMEVWLRDYVVYYDLDVSLLQNVTETEFDRAIAVLRDYKEADDDALFDAIGAVSTYQIARSRFCREFPDRTKSTLCTVYRAVGRFYERNRKYTLPETFFGRIYTTPYTMFYSAIFYPRREREDRTYRVSDLCSYTCRDGKWTCTRVWGKRGKSSDLGAVVRAVDALLRKAYAYPFPLKTDGIAKYLQLIIEDTIKTQQIKEKERASREVRIDLSKLQGIRDAADDTRDRLIVDAEPPDEPQAAPQPEPEPPIQENAPDLMADESAPDLTADETSILRAILTNQDAEALARGKGLMLSIVVDAINEKCFDRFGDTVLIFDGETPEVSDEFADELKGLYL